MLPINPRMGDLIHLSDRRADRSRPSGELTRFFFALDDPISYLAAERVERGLGPIEWVPVLGPLSERGGTSSDEEREMRARERLAIAEYEAQAYDIPVVEPHSFPMNSRRAARAACFAADEGVGAAFAVALLRLAFCGGFDIGSTPVIEEAAAVAGLTTGDATAAARDPQLDVQPRRDQPWPADARRQVAARDQRRRALVRRTERGERRGRLQLGAGAGGCPDAAGRLTRKSAVTAGSGRRGSNDRSCPRGSDR